MSPDPYLGSADIGNPQSLNRYGYVLNNPTGAVDPSGLVAAVPFASMDGVTFFEYVLDDGPELNFPHGGGRGGGGFGDILGGILGALNGGGLGGNSISGKCFLPGACPSLNVPSIGSLLPHIPGPGCDFGLCGNNLTPVLAGVGGRVIGGTLLCQILEPCGVVEDVAVVIASVALLASLVHEFSKGGKQNIRPSWAEPFGLPAPGESGKDYATRVCREAKRDCGSGPGSDFEKLKKWADRR